MLPLKYRVLEVLVDAYSGEKLSQNAESIIGAAFPEMISSALRSILAELKSDKLINYVFTPDNRVKGLLVSQQAHAVLISVREEMQRKEFEKKDARRWQIKSMIFGYAIGFISGVGVMIVREVLFK